jgi:hypothetical protein
MIIYNVTIKVEAAIANEWLQWMQEIHIPEVMQTGCFTDYKILRLLEVDETEGPTYAIQYNAESKAIYNQYILKFAPALRDKTYQKWGDRFIAFRSVMQVVHPM